MKIFRVWMPLKKGFIRIFRDRWIRRITMAIPVLIFIASLIYKYQPWTNLSKIAGTLQEMGSLGVLLYILMVTPAFIVPMAPDLVLVAAAGLTFGPIFGSVYAMAGGLLGATANFYLARYFGRPALERYLGEKRIRQIDQYTAKMGWVLLFIFRLVPGFNFSLVSLAAGLTNISFWKFISATFLGALPIIIIVSALGESIPENPILILIGVIVVVSAIVIAHRVLKSRHFRTHDQIK